MSNMAEVRPPSCAVPRCSPHTHSAESPLMISSMCAYVGNGGLFFVWKRGTVFIMKMNPDEIKFAPSYPRRKRFPRITSAGYEAGHRENFVGKARPTGRTIHYAAIHPRRQADGVFWPLPINNMKYRSALTDNRVWKPSVSCL